MSYTEMYRTHSISTHTPCDFGHMWRGQRVLKAGFFARCVVTSSRLSAVQIRLKNQKRENLLKQGIYLTAHKLTYKFLYLTIIRIFTEPRSGELNIHHFHRHWGE